MLDKTTEHSSNDTIVVKRHRDSRISGTVIIRVGEDLFLPYGVADSSVCFAFIAIKDILSQMG